MGNSVGRLNLAKADAATVRSAMEKAGYNLNRKPLRLNLNKQYVLKEYLEVHGGYGPNASAKLILGGVGASIAAAWMLSNGLRLMTHHETPTTINSGWRAAARQRDVEEGRTTIRKHKTGKEAKGIHFSTEAEKAKLEEAGESD